MKQDTIIEELHLFREEYACKFGFDTRAICKDLQEKQTSSGREVVSFPPRKPRQQDTPKTSIEAVRRIAPLTHPDHNSPPDSWPNTVDGNLQRNKIQEQ